MVRHLGSATTVAGKRPPNIVVIVADDLAVPARKQNALDGVLTMGTEVLAVREGGQLEAASHGQGMAIAGGALVGGLGATSQ